MQPPASPASHIRSWPSCSGSPVLTPLCIPGPLINECYLLKVLLFFFFFLVLLSFFGHLLYFYFTVFYLLACIINCFQVRKLYYMSPYPPHEILAKSVNVNVIIVRILTLDLLPSKLISLFSSKKSLKRFWKVKKHTFWEKKYDTEVWKVGSESTSPFMFPKYNLLFLAFECIFK